MESKLRFWNKFKNHFVVIDGYMQVPLHSEEVGTLSEQHDLITYAKEVGRLYIIHNFEDIEIQRTYRFPDHKEIINHCISVNNVLSNFSKNNPIKGK